VALNKDNAPGDVRPIVLMDTLLKFAERYALGQEIERMATLFEKERQYGGAGVKGGQEAAVHATRLQLSLAAMRAHYDDQEEEWGALQLDVVNAFGTLSRTAIARATRDHLPSWVPYTRSIYGKPSKLYFRVDGQEEPVVIWLCSGLRQGSPWSGLIYDLATLPVTRAVRDVCGEKGDIVGNHDDLVVLGGSTVLAKALPVFHATLAPLGLESNNRKLSTWFPAVTANGSLAETGQGNNQEFRAAGFHLERAEEDVDGEEEVEARATRLEQAEQEGLTVIRASDGVMIAGNAVGSRTFTEKALKTTWAKSKRLAEGIISKVAKHELQLAALVHRLCLPGKVNHVLRALPPALTVDLATEFDALHLDTFKTMMGLDVLERTPLQEERLDRQLVAPLKQDGMGFANTKVVAPLAYVASHLLVARLGAGGLHTARFQAGERAVRGGEAIGGGGACDGGARGRGGGGGNLGGEVRAGDELREDRYAGRAGGGGARGPAAGPNAASQGAPAQREGQGRDGVAPGGPPG